MKKIFVGLITVVAAMATVAVVLSALSASAYAGPPTPAGGSFVYTPTLGIPKIAGGNTFFHGTDVATWEGTFEGTSTEDYVVVMHGPDVWFYKGTVSFDGSVAGKEGTLEILFVGKSPGKLDDWTGTWRIVGGGEELAHLHGQGTFSNTKILHIAYSGRIHFDPKGE